MSKKPQKKLPPPFPVPFSESNPTPNVTSNTPHPPAVPPAGFGHYPPRQPQNTSSQPKTTSSNHVTSPTPTHSHFSRAVLSQPPPFPEPSTGHHYNPPVNVGPSVSRTPGGASVAQAGNYFQQGQPAQARNYSQQGQPATSNFTQMPNSTGGGALSGVQAQQAPVGVPCKLCGSLRRNAGMDDWSEFCSEEHKWAWRTQHPS